MAIQSLQLFTYDAFGMSYTPWRSFKEEDLQWLERMKGLKRIELLDYTGAAWGGRGKLDDMLKELAGEIWKWKREVEITARDDGGKWERELGNGKVGW